jgi:hypothetical protein
MWIPPQEITTSYESPDVVLQNELFEIVRIRTGILGFGKERFCIVLKMPDHPHVVAGNNPLSLYLHSTILMIITRGSNTRRTNFTMANY